MYSIVMIAALSGGPNTPAADQTPAPVPVAPVAVGCYGCSCYGCGGSCWGSCWGCGGCYGCSCYGCCGYSCHGCHGHGLFGHRWSCHGCCGSSCHGWSCWGSCHGCCGCYGGSCYGCGGCSGCYGGVYGSVSYPGFPGVPGMMVPPGGAPDTAPPPTDPSKKGGTPGGTMGANLKFNLPAGTKLYVDGRLTGGEGTERAFFTPALQPGQKYFYEVRAEFTAAGETVTEERRVIVEAGAQLVESFPKLFATAEKAGAVASK